MRTTVRQLIRLAAIRLHIRNGMTPHVMVTFGVALVLGTALQLGGQETANTSIKVTGCLQTSDANHGGVPTGAADGRRSESFVLTDVHSGRDTPNDSAKPSGASPPLGAAGGRSAGPWFVVIGNLDGLRKDVGHRVEITGTLDTVGSVLGTSASVTEGPSGTIQVSRLRVTAASCK